MRTVYSILSVAALAVGATCAHAQISVNAVISGPVVPGVYGQVAIGSAPPPPVVYAQPTIIEPVPAGAPPIYLHVPPGHAKDWRHHCHEYHACNRPVYFVKSAEYEPGFDRARWEREHAHDHDHDHDRDHGDRDHNDRDH